MELVRDVVLELFTFAASAVRGWFTSAPAPAQLIAPPSRIALPGARGASVAEPVTADDVRLQPPTFKTVADVIEQRDVAVSVIPEVTAIPTHTEQDEHSGARQIVAAEDAALYTGPTREFDAVLTHVPYGATVTVREERSAWSRVTFGGTTGWIERSALSGNFASVRPYFVIKEYCAPESETTRRARAIIGDEFNARLATLPLHPEEYVYYQLLARGLDLPETNVRPRRAGHWQKLFAGARGVHIGVRPKTGAVMEYIDADGTGHLAYVEAVFPDGSVSLSEVGDPDLGYYNERVLGTEVWQALAPVYIQFS